MSNHNSSFGLSLAPATGTAGNWQRRLAAAAGGGGWWRLVGLARSFCKARALLCAHSCALLSLGYLFFHCRPAVQIFLAYLIYLTTW